MFVITYFNSEHALQCDNRLVIWLYVFSGITLIDSVYNEFSFRGDTLERFNLEWDLLPPATYKVINDSLTTKSTNGSSTSSAKQKNGRRDVSKI